MHTALDGADVMGDLAFSAMGVALFDRLFCSDRAP